MTPDIFKTKDTALAAYLSMQFPMVQCFLGALDKRSVYFSFTRTKELSERMQLFFNGKATVEPNEYYGHIHICRKLITKALTGSSVDGGVV